MLNYLWAGMIIIGIIYGAFTGKMPDITNAASGFCKRCSNLVYYNGGSDGILDGNHGNCVPGRELLRWHRKK